MSSEKAAPQQAVTPGTADQGPGNSNEHDRAAPAEAPEMILSPAVVAAATADPSKTERNCRSSEGAGAASGGKPGKTQAVSGKPPRSLTPQQRSVVAAIMVVMKRAMLEGHEAFMTARERLWSNNFCTLVVFQFFSNEEELLSVNITEQMLRVPNLGPLDALAMQCAAAGVRPLQVFSRSIQCGVMIACRVACSRGEAAALARHQRVAELHEVLAQHTLTATWLRYNVSLLMRQGALERVAELIKLELVVLAGLCKRCFRPSDTWHVGMLDYAALDHLLPGT